MRLLLLLRASVSDLEPFKVFDLYFSIYSLKAFVPFTYWTKIVYIWPCLLSLLLFEIKSSKLCNPSRKNYQDCFTPCFLLSLNLQVRHISICSTYVPIVLTLCLRQITLPLLYTRQNVSSYKSPETFISFLRKQQAFDWASKAVYIRKIK